MTMQRDDPLHESSTFFFVPLIPTVCMTSHRCQECISSNMELFIDYIDTKLLANQTWNLVLKACYCMSLEYK